MFAVLELNDTELLVAQGGKILARSPGVAVVRPDLVETGEKAARISHLNPRLTFNRFWNDLSQDELPSGNERVRHQADLAYAHLQHVHQQAGKPQKFIVAVPGSFSAEQLSLLLGLAEASPFDIVGMIDTAVAAVSVSPVRAGVCHHIDLQMHQAIVTTLRVSDFVERTAVKVVAGAGALAFHDRCAAVIADHFIQQARLDPLHHAPTEQALYDKLPGVLRDLQRREEVLLELRLENSKYQAKVARTPLVQALQPLFERLSAAAGAPADCVVSHRLASLPLPHGFMVGARVLVETAAIEGCSRHTPAASGDGTAVGFVTRLRKSGDDTEAATVELPAAAVPAQVESRATHVLIGHIAYPIAERPIYVTARAGVSDRPQPDAVCSLGSAGTGAELRAEGRAAMLINGRQVERTAILKAGDVVSFAGNELTLQGIRVESHGTP